MVSIRFMLRSALGLALAVALQAAPIQWKAEDGGNDNWYEYVPAASIFAPLTFDGSRAAALASTHLGLSGYLATITSAEEQEFILSSFGFLYGFGATSTAFTGATDTVTEGSYLWMDGPEAGQAITYAPWFPGHPAGGPGLEDYDYVLLLLSAVTVGAPPVTGWVTSGNGALGYVIEYGDGIPDNAGSPVPEPSTMLLTFVAMLVTVGWNRRRIAGSGDRPSA